AGQMDTSGTVDAFLFDRAAGTTLLLSHDSNSATTTANGATYASAISGDGNVVTLDSKATNLFSGQTDTNASYDVFAFDRTENALALVPRESDWAKKTGKGGGGGFPAISTTGGVIVFPNASSNLVAGDLNAFDVVFAFPFPPQVCNVQINDGSAQRSR